MSKIDIDKLFRDKFVEQENSSHVYTPDRWKNFEKQLDKNLPADKKGSFRFNLNNLLIFIIPMVIVILVPLLLLQSKGIDNSLSTPGRTLLTHSNSANEVTSNENNSEKNQNTKNTVTIPANTLIPMQVDELAKENSLSAEAVSTKQISENNTPESIGEKIFKPVKKETVKINNSLVLKSNIINDTITVVPQNSAIIGDTNNKQKNKNGKVKKPGKIKRSGVLVPHVDYNGL